MELFDYIGTIFGSDKVWEEVGNNDKNKHSFMLNRLMSIQFPMQASMLNALKISQIGQAETWRMIGKQYKRTPGFIYTKTSTKKEKTKKKYSDDAVRKYMQINEIGEREFKEALKFNEEEILKSLEIIDKTYFSKK